MGPYTHTLVDYNASALCLACQQLPPVQECGPNYAHEIHNNLQELETCQCPFCQWLWKAILYQNGGIEAGPIEWIKEREEVVDLHINLLDEPASACLMERNCRKVIIFLPLYAFPDDQCSDTISARPIANDSRSEEAFSRIRDWMQECNCTHRNCDMEEAVLPTIVVEVGSDTDPIKRTRLIENNGSKTGHYIALSYVWGGPFTTDLQSLYLNSRNKGQYLEELPEEKLPQTIQDAIFASRKLGIQYLWIDALCIVQDDPEFKKQEILNMHRIYGDSTLTIQASFGKSVFDGFLQRRAPHPLADQRLRYGRNGMPSYVYLRPGNVLTGQVPAETRAWCYEESVLPRRLLVYSAKEMRYDCPESPRWEGGHRNAASPFSLTRQSTGPAWFKGVSSLNAPLSVRTPDSKLDYLKLWYTSLDQHYTPRILTHSGDRLPAIAAIARVLQERFTGAYHVGIWTNDLPWGLLWTSRRYRGMRFQNLLMARDWARRCPDDVMMRPAGAEQRHRAPSWSWASVDGPTNHQFTARFQGTVLVEIIKFPSGDDFLGDRGPWKLVLDAPTKLAYVSPIKRTPQELKATSGQWVHGIQVSAVTVLLNSPDPGEPADEDSDQVSIVNFDIEQEGRKRHGCSVLCVFMTDRTGLVVERTGDECRRLGTFDTHHYNFYQGEPKSRICLV